MSTLSLLPKEKDHRVRVMDVLSAVVHITNEISMHAKAQASNRMAKASRARHGPRVSPHTQAKVRLRENRKENPKENPKEPKVRTKEPKAYTRAKTHRKRVSQVLKTRNRKQIRELRNLHMSVPLIFLGMRVGIDDEWNDGWSFDEWNDDWSSVGRHEGWEQTYDTSASPFSIGGLDVSATSSPKRC